MVKGKHLSSDTFHGLLGGGKYSDLTLVCQGEEFQVHKSFVCWRSPVFAAAIDGGFKEATTNRVVIEDYDVATVKCMLNFVYSGTYDVDSSDEVVLIDETPMDISASSQSIDVSQSSAQAVPALIQHIRVNSIAGFYQIPELTRRANRKIQQLLDNGRTGCGALEPGLLCQGIDEAFRNSGDEELHQIMGNVAATNLQTLTSHDDFTSIYGMGESAHAIMLSLIALGRQIESDNKVRMEVLESEHAATKASFEKYRKDAEREKSLAKKALKDALASNKIIRDKIATMEKDLGLSKKTTPKPKPHHEKLPSRS